MKIIKNSIIPFGEYDAINLFGIIFIKGNASQTVLNHEAIHTAQMKELLYIFFYIIYGIEYLWNLIKYKDKAYDNISFEKEAYAHQRDFNYLDNRKHFAQWK